MNETPSPQQIAQLLNEAQRQIKALRARLADREREQREPIGIVGIGCRFPRGVNSAETFWQLLSAGVDAVGKAPDDRWNMEAFFNADSSVPGKHYSRHGAFLDHVDQFDHEFFGIAPAEAVHLDPQQRLLLETAWEALEDAGIAADRLRGSRTGAFVGAIYADYLIRQLRETGFDGINAYYGTGNALSAMAGRLSYHFGWQGPSISVDTACSTSLVAVHLACNAIHNRECDVALAGGVNLMLTPEPMINLSKARMMSSTGRCRTFDAGADGYVRGEGCGLVVLKRLSAAEADGDRVLGVIRGSAVNHDGRSNGLTAPNRQAQASLLRAALAAAGVDPGEVGYIECHGTGTPLGDPIEVGAIMDALMEGRAADRPLALGAVKTNYGHLEGAAGICGFIKTALVLQHGEIPANLHFEKLNPHIRTAGRPVLFPDRRTRWFDACESRIAGVSSFGLLGTNAHVVMEGYAAPRQLVTNSREPRLLALSARTQPALRALARSYAELLDTNPSLSLGDLCHTANTGRNHFEHRTTMLGTSVAQVREGLEAFLNGPDVEPVRNPRVAFLFTGQGSQHAGMGRRLYESEQVFRRALERCSDYLGAIEGRSLVSLLYTESDASLLNRTACTQPALFAFEYALAELLAGWGIEPAIALGHSVGEYVAACRAGIFSLEDGLKLVAARGALMQGLPHDGGMAAVRAPEETVLTALTPFADTLSIAALNGPTEVVISGRRDSLQTVLGRLAAEGYPARELHVSHAFHSALMKPMLADFKRVLDGVQFAEAEFPVISNVTGRLAVEDEMSRPSYWLEHVLAPVRFEESIRSLAGHGCDVVMEIGPQPVLANLVRRILPGASWRVVTGIKGSESDDAADLLGTIAEAYLAGCSVDWAEVERNRPGRKISLPTYPFQRRRIWFDAPAAMPVTAPDHNARVSLPPLPARRSGGLRFSLMFFAATQKVADVDKYRLVLEAARFADRHDFEAVWVPERHFSDMGSLYPNAAVLHSALARETSRVRLMAGSVVAPLHHPIRIAEEWSMVDNLSGGRVGISFASGWNPDDFALAPERYEERRDLLYSTATTVRRLWRGESLEVTNGAGQRVDLKILPTPIQKELPFWLTAAGNPKSFQKAGEVGANLLTHLLDQDIDELAGKIRLYRESRAQHGHDPEVGLVTVMVHTSVGADQAQAREAVRRPFCDYLKSSRNLLAGLAHSRGRHVDVAALSERDLDELVDFLFERFSGTRALIGSPESCEPLARALAAAGVNEIASLLDFGQTPEDALAGLPWLNQIRLNTRELEAPRKDTPPEPVIQVRSSSAAHALPPKAFYEAAWRELPKPAPPVAKAAPRWLILGDAGTLGDRIAAQAGVENSIIVRRGNKFPSFDTNEFWVPDLLPERLALVWGVTEFEFPTLDGVIFLWPLDAPDSPGRTAASLQASQVMVAEGARQLVHALGEVLPGRKLPVWWVTRGAVKTEADAHSPSLVQSPLWGFARVIRHEHPEWTGGLVDLDPAASDEVNAAALVEHLSAPGGEDAVALRGGQRWGQRLVRAERASGAESPFECRSDGAYLITGGLGGVGLKLAEWLAGRGARNLLLISRSPVRPAAQRVIESIEAGGTKVMAATADISNEDALAEALRQWRDDGGPPIRGVLHAAGSWHDAAISRMDSRTLSEVMAPKLAGTWNLDLQLSGEPLDFFVSFSSLSSLLPANGQANYAAANAFLDAHSQARRVQGRPALSINWGPWSEVGFGATEHGLRSHQRLESFGIYRISPEEALEALGSLLSHHAGQGAVARVDWRVLAQVDPDVARLPILSELTAGMLLETATHLRSEEAFTAARPEMLRETVANIVARVFRQPVDELRLNEPLPNLGLDSLMAMEIKNRILAETEVNVPIAQFLGGASVNVLVKWVTTELQLRQIAAAPDAGSAENAENVTEEFAL